MEKPFNILGLTLKTDIGEKRHKTMPRHLSSVAEGTVRRVEEKSKSRKTYRLTAFDAGRNLCISPVVDLEPPGKRNRNLQLQKWKEEKERERKNQQLKKKKPFLAGVYHAPINFEPLPPFKATRLPTNKSQFKFSKELKMFNTKDKKKPETVFTFGKANIAAKKSPSTGSTSSTSTIVLEASRGTQKPSTSKNTGKDVNSKQKSARIPVSTGINGKDKKIDKGAVARNTRSQNKVEVQKPIEKININKVSKKEIDNKNSVKNMKVQKKDERVVNKREQSANKKGQDLKKNDNIVNKKVQISNKNEKVLNKNFKVSTKKESNKIVIATNENDKVLAENGTTSNEENAVENENVNMTIENINKSLQLDSSAIEDIYICDNTSPKVTVARGKDKVRKENKQKLKDGLLAEDASDGQTVEHYRRQLASEIVRITHLCDQWDDILQKEVLPEFIQEKILAAVGLARLLMSQKFQQFASLVEKCAFPEPNTPLITSADLRGFWDLVFIQIEDIEMKFKALNKNRDSNWAEEEPAKKEFTRKIINKKQNVKPQATSRLRDMIAAARKTLKEQQEPPCEEEKTFEAGFFQIKSPIKVSPQFATPKSKQTLLRAVVSSEAKKASDKRKSFAIMRASTIGKQVEEDQSPLSTPTNLPLIDLSATPARSILKSITKRKTPKKSIKSVLFNDYDSAESDKENITPRKSIKSVLIHDHDSAENDKENKTPKKKTKIGVHSPKTRAQRKSSGFIIEAMDSPRLLRRSIRLSLKYD